LYSEIVDFAKTVGTLKKIKRKGWRTSAQIKDAESVADHTMRSVVLAMIFGDLKGLDTEKLMRMALLHDVHEALIGDYDYFDKKELGAQEVSKREKAAIKKVFSSLPEAVRDRYFLLAEEYLKQETDDAKLVRQIDRLEMVLQAFEYEKDGFEAARLQQFWDDVGKALTDADLKKIFEFLESER
jgi:putative hydrolase of HD superfamily